MAGGSILDMQDLGDGRYQATMANGSTPIFTGDAGRQAYERLRKQDSAMGPNALAQAPVPEGGPPIATDAPRPRMGQTVDAATEQAQVRAAGPEPGAPPPPQPSNSVLPYAAKGYDPVTGKEVSGQAVMKDGMMMVMRPGTKGSPGGITKLGQQTLDERAAAGATAAELEQGRRRGEMQGAAIATEQAAKEKAFLDKQAQEAATARSNAEAEALEADRHVADLQARADAAVEEHANSRMPEESTAQKFFEGLGAAMGAFGASLAKTPNFAAEFIQTLRNNKIRKWEAEVNIKGAKANNLLARLRDATGDMKLAKAYAASTLDRQAAVEAQQMAASTKTDQIRNAWETAANAAAQNYVTSKQKTDEDARLAFYNNKMYNRPAVAGTPGGFVPATQQSYGEAQDQSVQLAKLAADKAAAQGASVGAVESGRTEKIAGYAQGIQAAQTVISELAKRGVTKDAYDDPTAGALDRVANSQSNDVINQNTQVLAKGLQSAFGKSDRDAEDALKMAEGGGSGRARAQAAAAAQSRMISNLKAEIGTLPDAQKVKVLQTLPPEVRAKVLAQ